ncbi:MAG: toll/interleukin-1 receptor domain-containing protein [Verrucomicrobia bacterium]|nr:toll/interleukin-1 receptor domain-containing protein [Verrucomicrobiota bacterium]
MKIFISYAEGDAAVARRLVEGLRREGLDVWYDRDEIFPGDNWAEVAAGALKECQAMAVIFSPRAAESQSIQRDVSFALGNTRYRRRVFPILVEGAAPEVVPWVLRQYPLIQVSEDRSLAEAVKQIAGSLLAAV